MVPTSTPRKALYIETGLLDIETLDDKNRIAMGERLGKNSNNLLNEITNQDTPEGWNEYVEGMKIKYDITENTNEDEANNTSPKEKILEVFKTRIEREAENTSKINCPRGPSNMGPGTAETLQAPTRKNAGKCHI